MAKKIDCFESEGGDEAGGGGVALTWEQIARKGQGQTCRKCPEMVPGPARAPQFAPEMPIDFLTNFGKFQFGDPGRLRDGHVVALVDIQQQAKSVHWAGTGIFELHGIVEIEGPTGGGEGGGCRAKVEREPPGSETDRWPDH